MQVILSVPSPSEAARLVGQILSNIASTILEICTPPDPLTIGVILAELVVDLLKVEFAPESFFEGEDPAFLT
jgi:hypothetical protein